MMNQFAMIVIGGSYQDSLIDPSPIPENDSIWTFDTESGHWHRVKVKNQGASSDSVGQGHDVVPWNLVHHSAFKLDAQNIGVLWYDPEQLDGGEVRRNIMISTFNCKKCLWRNLKVARYGSPEPLSGYRFDSSVFPILDQETDKVSRVLVLGGIQLDDPLSR